jgi:hypothetical protein
MSEGNIQMLSKNTLEGMGKTISMEQLQLNLSMTVPVSMRERRELRRK